MPMVSRMSRLLPGRRRERMVERRVRSSRLERMTTISTAEIATSGARAMAGRAARRRSRISPATSRRAATSARRSRAAARRATVGGDGARRQRPAAQLRGARRLSRAADRAALPRRASAADRDRRTGARGLRRRPSSAACSCSRMPATPCSGTPATARPDAAEALYRRALDALVVILHERGTAYRPRPASPSSSASTSGSCRWELEHYLEWGVERRLGVHARARRRAAGTRRASTRSRASSPPRRPVLSHRDYHSWNILWRDDAPVIIDFQDALLAPAEYDLASLLTDRITPRARRPRDGGAPARLLLDAARPARPMRDRRRYALVALHRALKVIGRLHYIALAKGKPASARSSCPTCSRPRAASSPRSTLPGALATEFAALSWTPASGAASA